MSDNRPTIGDFRTPATNAPRAAEPDAPVPAVTTPPPVTPEGALVNAVDKVKEEAAAEETLSPAERYQRRLREANLTNAEAITVYDAVLSKGYYEQYVRLGKSGRAVFRTRLYEDALRLQTALEAQKPQLVISQDDIITRYNLAASLYEWQGKPVPHENELDFENALRLIRRMPAPVYSLLVNELSKFDAKVLAVFSEGAAENFS